jgi:hypothetical protein
LLEISHAITIESREPIPIWRRPEISGFTQGDGTQINAHCETQDPAETGRFAVLMRRFLIPEDRLYYKNVWAAIQTCGEYKITADWVNRINSLIVKVEAGYGKITINSDRAFGA